MLNANKKLSPYLHLNLQLLADGAGAGDGGTGEGSADNGGFATAKADLSSVVYGKQDIAASPTAEPTEPEDLNKSFEELIKGKYKDIYSAKVKATVENRLKSTKDTVSRYEASQPIFETLAKKYGVKADDIEGIAKALEDDDSYFEEEALAKGITVEQLKQIRKLEKDNSELKRQMSERDTQQKADELYASWMSQSEKLKQKYPSFNLETELANPQFVALLKTPSIDVETAFTVIHKDELIPSAMQYTAQQVEKKIANKIMANKARPAENGMGSNSTAVIKSDVSQLSKADRAEIIRRVQRGERIVF